MLKYKLTTQDNKTRPDEYNETLWGPGVTHGTDGKGDLCGPGWLHYYHWPEMAVLMNPIHANIPNPKLWECEAEGLHKDDCGLKGGCTKLTTIREILLPAFTMEQKTCIAILCAKEVCKNVQWNNWADRWLSGNRTINYVEFNALLSDAALLSYNCARNSLHMFLYDRESYIAVTISDSHKIGQINFNSVLEKAKNFNQKGE